MQRYEYRFVPINGNGLKNGPKGGPPPYHEVIHQYAAHGWRFVQAVGPNIGCTTLPGRIVLNDSLRIVYETVDLVFERQAGQKAGT